MLKEMMYKIFPKLLARAISDEQEHNEKQQVEIAALQDYMRTLKNNTKFYKVLLSPITATTTGFRLVNSYTIPTTGKYFVYFQVQLGNNNYAGNFEAQVYQNNHHWLVQSVKMDESDNMLVNVSGMDDFIKGVELTFGVFSNTANISYTIKANYTMAYAYKIN